MKKGFTLIELLVVIAIIAILAAILFPVFAKAREKARQTTCTSNQKQIATAVMMYTQENNEIMPPATNWASAIDVTGKILQCPTAGKKIAVAYGYNGNVAGLGLGEIDDPVSVILTADSVAEENLMYTPKDIDPRHVQKAIMSYVDSHVVYSADYGSVIFFPNKTLFNSLTASGNDFKNAAGDIVLQLVSGSANHTFNATTNTLRSGANEGVIRYTLPASDYTVPTKWYAYTLQIEVPTPNTNATDGRGADNLITFYDGAGKIIGGLYYYMWNNRQPNIYLFAGGVYNATATKKVYPIGNLSGYNVGSNWLDAGMPAAKKVYNFMTPPKSLTMIASTNGDVMLIYGDMLTEHISGLDFSNAPTFTCGGISTGTNGTCYSDFSKLGYNFK